MSAMKAFVEEYAEANDMTFEDALGSQGLVQAIEDAKPKEDTMTTSTPETTPESLIGKVFVLPGQGDRDFAIPFEVTDSGCVLYHKLFAYPEKEGYVSIQRDSSKLAWFTDYWFPATPEQAVKGLEAAKRGQQRVVNQTQAELEETQKVLAFLQSLPTDTPQS